MNFHRLGAHGIILILVILAATCEISQASKQCKAIVMDVHMKKCKLDAERIKRGLEKFDLQKHETYEGKRQERPDYSKTKYSELHSVPQKRQLSPTQISGIALPIVAEAINGAGKVRAYSMSGNDYQDPIPSVIGSSLGWPGYYVRAPFSFGRSLALLRAPVFNDDLGLNDEELHELYSNIYERLPRASKDEARKIFLETALKCCQNVDRCLKETMPIPCLGSQKS
ncbi:hypothetical protein PUN28_004668 [Cardiocondyla obscurior]|uniref:Uncharacterized protein n=1 Tax=Cardiocondyla obscurior TaxID=286306 RepID=A0AAW2GF37_9HYME